MPAENENGRRDRTERPAFQIDSRGESLTRGSESTRRMLGAIQEGALFADRYRIRKKLGQGGMGAVYLAHDPVLDADVALKMLFHSGASDAAQRDRLLREAQVAFSLDHPNIVRVHNAGLSDDILYIVMDYVPGKSLADAVQEHARDGECPDLGWVLDVFLAICGALECVHSRGMVHRDLKPGNILLAGDGRVLLADFGLVRTGDPRGATEGGSLGTPAYMAPEQVVNSSDVDQRSDLYALGVMLHEVLMNALPGKGPSLTQHPSPHRHALHRIYTKCCAQRREDRYRRVQDIEQELKRLSTRTPVPRLQVDPDSLSFSAGERARICLRLPECPSVALDAALVPPWDAPPCYEDFYFPQNDTAELALDLPIPAEFAKSRLTLKIYLGIHAGESMHWFLGRISLRRPPNESPGGTASPRSNDRQPAEWIDVSLEPTSRPLRLPQLVSPNHAEYRERAAAAMERARETASRAARATDTTPPAAVPLDAGAINSRPRPSLCAIESQEALRRTQQEWCNYLGVDPSFDDAFGLRFVLVPPGRITVKLDEKEQPFRENVVAPFWISSQPVPRDLLLDLFRALADEGNLRIATALRTPAFLAPRGDGVALCPGEVLELCEYLSKRSHSRYRLASELEWAYAVAGPSNAPDHLCSSVLGIQAAVGTVELTGSPYTPLNSRRYSDNISSTVSTSLVVRSIEKTGCRMNAGSRIRLPSVAVRLVVDAE